jgi:hypothetical protein
MNIKEIGSGRLDWIHLAQNRDHCWGSCEHVNEPSGTIKGEEVLDRLSDCQLLQRSPSLLSNGYQGLSLGIKWPRREADHSPPSSAGIKNAWSYTSTSQYSFIF